MTALERFDLSGRTALITGAAGLLGIEHASALLESGAVVVLTDINDAQLAAARATRAPRADAVVAALPVSSRQSARAEIGLTAGKLIVVRSSMPRRNTVSRHRSSI